MCLHVDRKAMGLLNTTLPVRESDALISIRPLLVKKVLVHGNHDYSGYTPFRFFEMFFGTQYYSHQKFDIWWADINGGGFHCLAHDANRDNSSWVADDIVSSKIFPAIIPANTPFFIGNEKDIVAKSLIVYKTMADLIKAHGKPEIKGAKPMIHYSKRVK